MYSVCKNSSPNRRNVGHSIDLLLPWVLSLSLIRAEQQRRVPKTDAHNYIGTMYSVSKSSSPNRRNVGHSIDLLLPWVLSLSLIRAEQQRRVPKTDAHNYIGTMYSVSKSSSPNRRNVGHSIDLLLPRVLSPVPN